MELYKTAIRKNGMTVGAGAINDKVEAFARRAKIKPTLIQVVVDLDKPREAIKDFKKSQLEDIECFAKTLDRIETDLGTMKQRANAWATGDLEALRALPYTNQFVACTQAIQRAGVLREAGDLDARVRQAWLDAATKALVDNASSFAVLPLDAVIGRDNYLAALRERGYVVQAPDEQDEAPVASAP